MFSVNLNIDDSSIKSLFEGDLISDELNNFLFRLGIKSSDKLKSGVKKITVTNTLFNSVDFSVEKGDNVSVFATASHSEIALETGRKPGRMPNIKAITRWAKKRNINASPYAIAKSIAKKGTKRHRGLAGKPIFSDIFFKEVTGSFLKKEIDKFIDKIYGD